MRTKGITLGWLVGAAARKAVGGAMTAAALLFAGCSSEDDTIAGEPKTTEPTAQATVIRVTVGAGISDGEATTRSTVVKDGSTRTLQFTSGDRLYVWGHYGDEESEPSGMTYYPYIVAGYLDLDTESFDASDPTNATFTGELTVYSWVNEVGHDEVMNEEAGDFEYMVDENGYYTPASSSPSFSTADPLGECNDVTGTLIHKDAVKDVDYVISEGDRMVYYRPDCAATVEELMTTKLWVSGEYDSGTKSFALEKDRNQPIVNCTISGLEAGVSYKVDYIYGTTAAMSDHTRMLFSSMTATAGTLSFAFIAETGDKFHGIRLTNTAEPTDTYDASIGQKEFESKVYNAARTAIGKKTPLTMEAITGGTIKVNYPKSGMQYRLNGGDKTLMTETTTIEVAKGDKVQFYGNGTTITNYLGTFFANGTATVKVYGNIMSLVDEEGFASATTLTSNQTFAVLFANNDKLTDASGLLLPATTLTSDCYVSMFNGCTSLTAAPVLPAETLASNCYYQMFKGCTSLTAAPALDAETLAIYCYEQMFQGCTSLTSVPAKLPATTLANYCYKQMFQGCSSLTTAPELPATTLKDYCYQEMFSGCSSLNAVTCLATDKSATNPTKNWLSGVAATGTFTRAKGVTWSTSSPSGIPTGWTKVDAQ